MADETWKMDFEALRESELNRDSYLEYLREYEIIETYKLEMTKKSCKEQTVKVLEEMSGTLKSDPPRPTSASAPVDVIVSAIEVFEDMKVLSAIRVFDEFPEQVYATAHPDLAIKTGVHLLPALDVFVEMPIPVVVAEIGAELAHAGGSICILGVESVVTTATKKLDIFKVFEEMSVPLKWVNESVCTSNFQQGNSRITSSILILELHKFVLGNYEPWDPGGLTHATILQECISGHATCCLKLKVFWEASWICSKLQDVELWNLLDTKRDVQRRIVHVTCPRSAEEDEVLGQGCLAIDIIERADNAVDKLNFLKASKMREQNELEEIYRGIHMAEALIMIMKKIEGLVKMSTTSDDATESVVGQIMPSLSFFIVDSKSSKECPSHLDKINQCEGNNIMDEPPSVKEFAVLLPFEGELEDSQIRKLEFPSLPEGNLVDSHFEEEHESITEPSVVLGATGLHVLKEHDLCLHNTKQQPSSGLKSGEDIEDYIDNKLLHKECNAELEFNQEGLNVVSSPDEKLESTKPIEYLVSQEQSQLEQCDTICNLNAISSSTGFGDMHFVLFQIEVNHRLPQITLSPGDMVCVRICNRRGAEAASCMQGFVNNLGEDGCSITVALESRHGDPTFSKLFGKSVRIDRIPGLADALTYERNCEALMLLQKNGLQKKNPSIAAVATLFGDKEDLMNLEKDCLIEWGQVELDGLIDKEKFDSSQQKAIALGLNKKRPLLVVQGPPGTGKTRVLTELISLAVRLGERVLVTAPTNAAVDNMVERLANMKLNIVRVGNPARISPSVLSKSLGEIVNDKLANFKMEFERKKSDLRKDLRHCLKDDSLAEGIRQLLKQLGKTLKKKEKDTIKEVLSNAQVVLSTNTGSADPLIRRLDNFDLVVIDEAAQAIEPSCWIPILQGKRCVLAGDQCQLAPVILSRRAMDGGLGISLLEKASSLHDGMLATKLTVQYRMHDAISSWASKEMYDGLLRSSPTVSSHLLVDSPFVKATWITQCSLLLLDTRMPYGSLYVGCEEHLDPAGTGSFYNEGEADIVVQHVFNLIYSGVSPTAIAVQSPYIAQVQLLRDRLDEYPEASGVEVATIDSFQGREADAVIISMVRSNTLGAVGFLGDSRRMNVAITRARKHIALVCDSSTICHNTFLARLLRHIRHFGRVKHAEPGSFGGSGLSMTPMLPFIS